MFWIFVKTNIIFQTIMIVKIVNINVSFHKILPIFRLIFSKHIVSYIEIFLCGIYNSANSMDFALLCVEFEKLCIDFIRSLFTHFFFIILFLD